MAKTDKNYTVVQMEEKKPADAGHDLEEPFDEDFWLKVRMFCCHLNANYPRGTCILVCFDIQNLTLDRCPRSFFIICLFIVMIQQGCNINNANVSKCLTLTSS